jgi:hypothetical protein
VPNSSLLLCWFVKILDWIERQIDWIRPLRHPSTMSSDEIASELGRVWAKPYSRRNQRRAALLLDFDGKAEFSGLPSEDIFETVVGFAMRTSLLIGGKPTTVQHSYASMMLYRICIISSSITGIYQQHERASTRSDVGLWFYRRSVPNTLRCLDNVLVSHGSNFG